MKKIKVGIIFGSRSVEHEVSITTAMQTIANIDRKKYDVIPIYIDKKGLWWIGNNLNQIDTFRNLELINKKGLVEFGMPNRTNNSFIYPIKNKLFNLKSQKIDIIFSAIHGTYGEDGTLQGLLEMANIPYTGCGVEASAISMDKVIQKTIFEKENIPTVKYTWFYDWEWKNNKKGIISKTEKYLNYPMCVKPVNLGSSVGISMAKNRIELEKSVLIAIEFDTKILIEEGLIGIDEINVSVMGNTKLEVSVCEQPIKDNDLLTYEDKYLKGGKTKGMANLSRLIPAPINQNLTKTIEEYALKAFRALGCSGVSRIDFLVNIKKEKIFINEINTLPGSLSYYLWNKSGYTFSKLIDKLIELGIEKFEQKNKKLFSIDIKSLSKTTGIKS